MKQFPNFYENVQEANIRLNKTVVLYDGVPNHIFAICDHKKDGIFRVYMYPIGVEEGFKFPGPAMNLAAGSAALGPAMDTWMAENKGSIVERKMMNSPKFNKFRPFPLGMCNFNGKGGPSTYYMERQPLRPNTAQGLVNGMILETEINTAPYKEKSQTAAGMSLNNPALRACILGEHPSAQEGLAALLDPKMANEAIGFHRNFALALGPIDMVFLAYKTDVVGALPHSDFTKVRLGRNYYHLAEVVDKLNLFGQVIAAKS